MKSPTSPKTKFTKTIMQYKQQIHNMRSYLKDLETKKITPNKERSESARSVRSYLTPNRNLRHLEDVLAGAQ